MFFFLTIKSILNDAYFLLLKKKVDSQNIQQIAPPVQPDPAVIAAQQAAEEKLAKQAKSSKKTSKKEPTPEPPPVSSLNLNLYYSKP
jgi:hypothetical protein